MTTEGETSEETELSPHDAFGALANETRMEILQILGQADGVMTFSELRDELGFRDPGNFQYHLNKLTDHFVRHSDDGYELKHPGRRVIEAILSGAVTGGPDLEATPIDASCTICGGSTEVSYRDERMLWRCTECVGRFSGVESTSKAFGVLPEGTLELAYLPAAGTQNRSPEEMLEASDVWSAAEDVTITNGVCPRCSGTVEDSLRICETHDDTGELCDDCGSRVGVLVSSRCTHCGHTKVSTIVIRLLADPTFRAAFDGRGVDVISTDDADLSSFVVVDHEVVETEPFRARITHVIKGDEVSFVIDDDFAVVEMIE